MKKMFIMMLVAGVVVSVSAQAKTKNTSTKNFAISSNKNQISVRPKSKTYPNANKVYNFPLNGQPNSTVRWK